MSLEGVLESQRTAEREAERNDWIRLFNRLEAAVRRHIDSKPWNDEHDDQLHASFKAVLKDAHDR